MQRSSSSSAWKLGFLAGALLFSASVSVAACKKSAPSALAVCEKLTAAGVAKNCRGTWPNGLAIAADEAVAFDLTSVSGELGKVLSFKNVADLQTTIKAFHGAAATVGPHRYSSKSALVFVHLHSAAPKGDGAETKKVLAGL